MSEQTGYGMVPHASASLRERHRRLTALSTIKRNDKYSGYNTVCSKVAAIASCTFALIALVSNHLRNFSRPTRNAPTLLTTRQHNRWAESAGLGVDKLGIHWGWYWLLAQYGILLSANDVPSVVVLFCTLVLYGTNVCAVPCWLYTGSTLLADSSSVRWGRYQLRTNWLIGIRLFWLLYVNWLTGGTWQTCLLFFSRFNAQRGKPVQALMLINIWYNTLAFPFEGVELTYSMIFASLQEEVWTVGSLMWPSPLAVGQLH